MNRRIADWIEARMDCMDAHAHDRCLAACRKLERSGTPVLVTIRSRREGGHWTPSGSSRLELYRKAIEVISWVDVELRSRIAGDVLAAARARRKKTVLSHHNFERTPALAVLQRTVACAFDRGADVVKIATMVNCASDGETLTRLLVSNIKGPLCVIGMGPKGALLRCHLPSVGSVLAYGYLDKPVAPGQLSCETLAKRLQAG
ncbi:MAG: type I 3-dehydroquinate dehydratase [Verrucomicrobia bacterium]|nr:type I 3-dehydroquinate dehydratase [Verrucomicrobiota bacterium]